MTERMASCSCGELTAEASGEPFRISICHCLQCKRRTGSAFAYNANFEASRVVTSGTASTYTRAPEGGYWAKQHFCPTCGATVFYEIECRPGMITIPVGAFADPDFPGPTVSVFDERRHRWCATATVGELRME